MTITALLILLLIGGGIWWMANSVKLRTRSIHRKWTYGMFFTYVILLVVATIVTGLLSNTKAAEQTSLASEANFDPFNPFWEGNDFSSVDPSLVIDKRTHTVGDWLALELVENNSDMNMIIIERKEVNDGVIEETIIRPLLLVNGFDFSDRVQYTKPQWDEDRVTFPLPSATDIKISIYQDSFVLTQFTRKKQEYFGSFNTLSRQIAVHLLIPKDLQLEIDDNLYVKYIES